MRTRSIAAVLGLLAIAGLHGADAATLTWDGGAGGRNWSAANLSGPFSGTRVTNWSTSASGVQSPRLPINGDVLNFDGSTGLTSNNNDFTNLSLAGLRFARNAGSFDLKGNALRLTGGITLDSTRSQRITLPLTVAGTQLWELVGSGSLEVERLAFDDVNAIALRISKPDSSSVTLGAGGMTNAGSRTVALLPWVQGQFVPGAGGLAVGASQVWDGGASQAGIEVYMPVAVGNNTLTLRNNVQVINTQNTLRLGVGGQGRLEVDGRSGWSASSIGLGMSSDGTGELQVSGGAIVTARTSVDVGALGRGLLDLRSGGWLRAPTLNLGDLGVTRLAGGVLEVGGVTRAAGGVFDWTGGALRYTGNARLGEGLLDGIQTLDGGRTLSVAGTLSIGPGQLLLTDGAQSLEAGMIALSGGRITGPVGLQGLRGFGSVHGKVTGGAGATIQAVDGNLSLGNLGSATGFAFDGLLEVGQRMVALLSAGRAQLGHTTSLADGGQLATVHGANLAAGQRLLFTGQASVLGDFVNNGQVLGTSGTLRFLNDVSGAGSFAGQVVFEAGYRPGNSPATVRFDGGDVHFGSASVLTMEIFGAMPGTQYDQLLDIGTLDFQGRLSLVFGEGFVPLAGSSFQLLGFQTLTGSLAPERIDVAGFERGRLDLTHLGQDGRISVTAVPEPASALMLSAGLALLGACARRRRTAARLR